MTQCTRDSFPFEAHFFRSVVADFQGGTLTSDAGGLLLRQTDRRLGLLNRLALCFEDFRSQDLCQHRVEQMLAQPLYALALGYEDLNHHDQLRQDPLMGVLAGKREADQPLASKSTLCRLERTPSAGSRPVPLPQDPLPAGSHRPVAGGTVPEVLRSATGEIVLYLDVTDLPLHGCQEGRFFHGFYDEYCYLPLHIFCGDQLLGVRLRTTDQDASAGSLEEVQRIVAKSARAGLRWASSCAPIRVSAARS